jgi:hypothetical protein
MPKGKVMVAARTKGLTSLTKVAEALIRGHPDLFEGVAARSLGAKLSELNREKVTWWRSRADRLEAVRDLLGLDLGELLVSEQARQRGLWVCEEFPALPALDLVNEQPPTLTEPVPTASGLKHPPDLENWLRVGLGRDHEQHPMTRPSEGVKWLHIPKGTGRRLLISRIKARGRLAVFEGDTLAEAIAQSSRSHPVILAPVRATSGDELVALAEFDVEQPVLIISAHPLPALLQETAASRYYPSWEWLSAPRAKRVRSMFTADAVDVFGGALAPDPVVEFRLQLLPTWRSHLLKWTEGRFAKDEETLFTAEGLDNWLEAFDPDSVLFSTPAAVLSLARICHEVGERRLPKPGSPDAGMQLLRQLGRADSRYQSLLTRLVRHCWLDADASWLRAKPWDDWLTSGEPLRTKPNAGRALGSQANSAAVNATGSDVAPLTETDLDAAVKSNLLAPDNDGNYGFSSYAEAALVLRDQLDRWMRARELGKWGAQVVNDAERQRLVDEALRTVDNQILIEMCVLAAKLPMWSAEALGASETLFMAVGLRMAEGTLNYTAELGELLVQTLGRCISDDAFVTLPLSRSLRADADRVDWIRASWGWSLIAPKPVWVPASLIYDFPGWFDDRITWLLSLPIPESGSTLPVTHFKRLKAAVNTAVLVTDRVGFAQPFSPEVLQSIVGLLRVARGHEPAQPHWWHNIARERWALEILGDSITDIGPDAQQVLAKSLLEAFTTKGGFRLGGIALTRSPLWPRLFNVNDVAALCDSLTPAALVFVASHIYTFPQPLRQFLADRVDPAQMPLDFAWDTLLSATAAPEKERLDQLLDDTHLHRDRLSAVLWNVHPNHCLRWATDPGNRNHELLLERCPPQWGGDLAALLIQTPDLVQALNIRPEWATNRLADAGQGAAALLQLLASAWKENPNT